MSIYWNRSSEEFDVYDKKYYPEPHHGQCQCVYSNIPEWVCEDIIFLIDEYLHIGRYVESTILESLFDPFQAANGSIVATQSECRARYKLYGSGIYKLWKFEGDDAMNVKILINDTCVTNGLSGTSNVALCTIRRGPGVNGSLVVCVNNIPIGPIFGMTWNGSNLTPFCKKQRRQLKAATYIHNIECPGQKYDPIDVMCDAAHIAIWTWFHGGDVTPDILPRPTKSKNTGVDNILADYYDHAVHKLYKNDDRFQRPHRKKIIATDRAQEHRPRQAFQLL